MTDVYQEYFRANVFTMDMFHLICGRKLGEGAYRAVYGCAYDDSLVVKFEIPSKSFSNAAEWRIWEDVRDHKKTRKWLAPCINISNCGSILIQKRTQPLPKDYELTKKIPDWLCDVKRSNWGLLDGKLVCHDYGNHQCPADKQKLVKTSFWC